jgi:hypothetical protein
MVDSCIPARKDGVSIIKESMEARGLNMGRRREGFGRCWGLVNKGEKFN